MGVAGLLATGAGTAFLLVRGPRATLATALAALVLALLGYAVTLREAWSGSVSRRAVMATVAVLLGLAVAVPPWPSSDLYVYAMQGRIVSVHHDNPYQNPPRDYPDDPTLARVAHPYRGSPAYYGPAFVGVSAAGMAVVGTSPVAMRLFFQGLAALAVLVALALLSRVSRDAGALGFLGLNPAVITRGVNEAHLDVMLGLVLLMAVLLLRRRPLVAGVVMGVATLVKVVAVLPVAAAAAWAWRHHGARTGAWVAACSGVTAAGGYLLAGGPAALAPLRGAGDDVSRSSIWTHTRPWLTSGNDTAPLVGVVVAGFALIVVVALAAGLVTMWWRDRTPERPVSAALAAYLLAGTYVLPWYSAGALPALALRWRSGLALLVSAHSGLLTLAYLQAPGGARGPLPGVLRAYWQWVLPTLQVGAVAGLAYVALRRLWPAGGDAEPVAVAARGSRPR